MVASEASCGQPDVPGNEADQLALLCGDLAGARVVGMGRDIWELAGAVVPRLGVSGSYLGVHVEPSAVSEARRINEHPSIEVPLVEFHEVGEDLRSSITAAGAEAGNVPSASRGQNARVQAQGLRARGGQPLVADGSVDVVFATGLRDLADKSARSRMLKDFHRVTRRGGRLVVLDVVSDEQIPANAASFASDRAEIGRSIVCETELVDAVVEVGFYGATLIRREISPWKIVDGVELRRVALIAYKGKEGPCREHYEAVMYRGPFSEVHDDDGHVYPRGRQVAVCRKTFEILSRSPYAGQFEYSRPLMPVAPEAARPFPCGAGTTLRDPRDLKFRLVNRDLRGGRVDVVAGSVDAARLRANAVTSQRRKKVVIVERSPMSGDQARQLAVALREKHAERLDVEVVDLTVTPDARLSSQLKFRLSLGDGCLPAIVVDGVLVALGGLPSEEGAAALIADGRPFGTLKLAGRSDSVPASKVCDSAGCC